MLRRFNLDRGADIANLVDDMPVNRPANTCGQGYSDSNCYLLEVIDGLDVGCERACIQSAAMINPNARPCSHARL